MSIKQRILAHPAVESAHMEDGTWWVWLHHDWINPELECSQIHERTLAECWDVLKGCRKKQPA